MIGKNGNPSAFLRNKAAFKKCVSSYQPTGFEMAPEGDRSFCSGTHFLENNAYRFYRLFYFICSQNFESILDIGCFPGTFIRVLHEFMPDKKIAGAGLGLNEAFRKAHPYAQFYDCNFDPDVYFHEYLAVPQTLPVADGTFDAVVATEIMEHLYNPFTLAREMFRVLKPGGFCYLTTNNYSSLTHILRMLSGKTPSTLNFSSVPFTERNQYYWRPHIRFYSREELRGILRKVGFANITCQGFWQEEWYRNKKHPLKRLLKNHLLNKIIPDLYCSNHEVYATKDRPELS